MHEVKKRKKLTYVGYDGRYHGPLHQTFPIKALKPAGKERRRGEEREEREERERERGGKRERVNAA